MLDLMERNDEAETSVETVTVAGLEAAAETRRNVGRFSRAMWVAAFILLLFNSGQLVTVVNGFGVGPVQDTVVAVVATWNAQMEKTGLAKPVQEIRDYMERMRDESWAELQAATRPSHNERGAALRGPLDESRS
ncbi:MAG TPA: hypothetical protein VF449_11610 [Parvibaculum sp.]